eukprot:4028123-Pleurochrysis_carterae.AAC.1
MEFADNDGYTALHWAAACGHTDVVDALISAGADGSATDAKGETPLHRAARLGRTEAVKRLVKSGGRSAVFAMNDDCETCLDVAGRIDVGGGAVRNLRAVRSSVRREVLSLLPEAKLLVLHHAECQQHLTGDTHQEHPLRLTGILQRLTEGGASGRGWCAAAKSCRGSSLSRRSISLPLLL